MTSWSSLFGIRPELTSHEQQDAGKQRPYYGRGNVVRRDGWPRAAGRGQAASLLWTAEDEKMCYYER
ncbi:MAG: hypothetical protein ACRDHW_21460 [Ktedonobacteraceae bacterium]